MAMNRQDKPIDNAKTDSRRLYGPPKLEDSSRQEYLDRIAQACAKGAGWNRKPQAKRVARERPEQVDLAEWLDVVCAQLVRELRLPPRMFRGALVDWPGWCHVPNERDAKVQHLTSLAHQGVKSGVSDCLIFVVPRGATFPGVGLELKEPQATASSVSPNQHSWLDGLAARGWQTRACFGSEEAKDWLESLGYGVAHTGGRP